ncbi:hypothetical protein BJY01DRAFT_93789 [Aspergillus pseudoustus]|uniref:Fork-head domain-containing protein n=1 Tax=Aspergillus pseudoustus TaxID=1810923 RepID=A0ABR4IZK3_9EURO
MSRFGHPSYTRDPLRHSISSTSDTSPSSVLDSASACDGNSPRENWSDSSSSSPETMMPYQQPWVIEPATNYSIITTPSSPLSDGLPHIHGPAYIEGLPPRMASNYSPTRQLKPEMRRLPAGKPLYKASLPAATVPPHSQSSSPSSTNPTPTTSLSPTSAGMPYHSLPLSMVSPPVKHEIDREDIAMDETEDTNADPPYSQLIYEALLTAPGKKLPLQGIYLWFEKNTAKGRDRRSKGWQNSIRHNLSMNAGFEAVREESTPGKKAVNYWRLTDEAITNGIQSTTRYRKQANYKKSVAADPPAPQRQRSGAKGGKATKITARFRSSQSMNSMPSMGQDDYQRERGCRQQQPFPRQYHQEAQRIIPSQRQHHHHLPPTKNFLYSQYLHRPSTTPTTTGLSQGGGGGTTLPLTRPPPVEGFDLGNIVGCAEAPPCTAPTPIFCDMAGPGPDCLVFDTGFMAWDGMHPSFANSEISTADLHVGL